MKANSLVADEMFPDGGGRYLGFEMVTDNIEEIVSFVSIIWIEKYSMFSKSKYFS